MELFTIREGRYTYTHENRGPHKALDVHYIVVPRKLCRGSNLFIVAVVFASAAFLFPHSPLENLITATLWSFILAGFLLWLSLKRQVSKESVIIFAGFGVQLETVFRSGKTVHNFVPMGKILKPVLTERVTPFSCYWSLSLIIQGDEELLPVLKEFHPPVKLLVPIWKALRMAIADEECSERYADCDTQ